MRMDKRFFSFGRLLGLGGWLGLGWALAFSQGASGRWEVQRPYVNETEGGYLNVHQSWQPYHQKRYCERIVCRDEFGNIISVVDCLPQQPCSPCPVGLFPECVQCGNWIPHFHCTHCITGGGIPLVCNDCLGPVCNPFQAHLPSEEGLPWAVASSGDEVYHTPAERGSQSASGQTYLKLVWTSENELPPARVNVETIVGVIARAVATQGGYGTASATASASIGPLSVSANASTGGTLQEEEATIDLLTKELPVRQDASGRYYVLVPYSVSLSTALDVDPTGEEDYCQFPGVTRPHGTNDGRAEASFDRFLDIFDAGDVIFLVSGTALVDGAGAICDPDACGLQPATGQIADGVPLPALDAAHSGYAFHSAPSHAAQPLYGLETIQIIYDSGGEPGDIRLKDYWRGSPVVPTWETFPPPPLTGDLQTKFDTQVPKERQVMIYDAGGTALRFLATEPLPDGRWLYTGVQGVFSTLLEVEAHTFVLLGGPPGAMHAPGAWKYTFSPIPFQEVNGQPRYSGQSALLTRIDDPLGNSITLTRTARVSPSPIHCPGANYALQAHLRPLPCNINPFVPTAGRRLGKSSGHR